MNRLNRKLEYALIALKHMSNKIPGELTSATEVSETYSTPFDATARAMQVMANQGWLKSEQGVAGGYQITKDLGKINLYEFSEVIEGRTAIAKCFHKESPCEIQGTCNIVSPVTNLNNMLVGFYKSVSLKDLLVDSAKKSKREEVTHV